MRLGVVAALPAEARCLLSRRIKPGQRYPLDQSRLHNAGWLQLSGMGPQNARRAAESLISSGVEALVSWGVAAGLASQLRRGHLILPKTIISSDGQNFAVDTAWHARFCAVVTGVSEFSMGSVAETVTALASPQDKSALFGRTGAMAADMESAAIAAVAQQAGVPFMAVRAVVDGHDAVVPPAAMAAVDMDGNTHALSCAISLLQHPAQFLDMISLALGMRAACASLTRVAPFLDQ